jgi:hypothetical protein
MRVLSRLAAAVAVALPLAVSVAAPASAAGIGTCPGGEPTCVYLSGSYPITDPVVVPVTGTADKWFVSPLVCDSTGTKCYGVAVGIPGAMVSSAGGTIGWLNFAGTGIGVSSSGQVKVYATTLPTFTPGPGVVASVSVSEKQLPVIVIAPGIAWACMQPGVTTLGPVTVTKSGCDLTATVTV